jgi:enediyne biosynthesis protein E4
VKSEKRAKLKYCVDRKLPILVGAQGLAPLLSSVVLLALVAYRGSLPAVTPAPPRVEFTNVTENAGIHFLHFKGNDGTSTILEEAGPGVCVADYDGDGFQDIYFVNGRDLYGRGIEVRNALYHNNGDGTFTDVTERAGVSGTGYGLGCVWGDYDNDGYPDLYVTQYGKNVLYHNNGDGTFSDATDRAGVGGLDYGTQFHTGATFFDYDRDGKLDLYVGGYCGFLPTSRRTCDIGHGVQSSCRPTVYGGTPDVLYHNNGDGTFTEVTKQTKVFNPQGVNLAVGAADYDNDGWPDLFVANDGSPAFLYHNNHDGTFTEVGMSSGMALTADGNAMAAMCISLGDYEHTGWMGLFITDFQMVPDHLWQNNGHAYFDEVSERAGIAEPTKAVLSFGGGFFDYDNDGWLDLFIANGSVYPEIEQVAPEIHYKQINMLFHNEHHGWFREVTKESGEGLAKPFAGRGVAFADFDNDGAVDVIVANNGDPPLLLHNSGMKKYHFINFKLVGARSNRDAIGARLKLTAAGVTQIAEVEAGGSYLSQSDVRVNFGLGPARRVERVEVAWPSGLRQVFRNLQSDKFYRIVEGNPRADFQKFFPHRIEAR